MPPKRSGLGRGLDALIPRTPPAIMPEETAAQSDSARLDAVRQIAVEDIHPNPRQPRTQFDPSEIEDLASSIREHGIIQPLIVTRGSRNEGYTLIAGERRLQAARLAGLESVPAILREASDQDMLELALIENVQRADLSPLETAEAYRQLIEEFLLSHEEVAARVGKSRVSVTNTVRLLKLPPVVHRALAERQITEGHARSMLALNTPQAQAAVLKTVLGKELNVRQTEELVRKYGGSRPEKPLKDDGLTPEVLDVQERLRSRLGTKVDIHPGKKGGTITIYYYSDEELNALMDTFVE